MNLAAFQILRNGLKMNAAPATAQARKVFEDGLREEMLATGLFEDVEVGSSDDADRNVIALCTYRADVDDDATVLAIQMAWAGLAFHHWEAHAFLTADGHVEFQAATLDRPAGRYVSVHLVAQRAAEMPQQRRHEEAPILAYSA
jgi:hypothetical protein